MAIIYGLSFKDESGMYIGCTRGKIAKRLREHRSLLKANRHTCQLLQYRFNQTTSELHIFAIDYCSDDLESRRIAELKAMDEAGQSLINDRFSFRPTDEAIRKGVANAHKVPGNRWTAEANERRSKAQLGKPKGHGAKISATKRARQLMSDEIV